jgi:uncharacterized protein YegL
MAKTKNPLWTASKGVRGGVLKQIVFKQYKDKTIATKYPDMSNITQTELQIKGNNKFADAIIFAKDIINDPIKKAKYKRINGLSVYHSAIKNYMSQP